MKSKTCQAVLGIDLGTSSVKSLLMAVDTGDTLAQAAVDYPLSMPQPGWVEQNPSDWLTSAIQSIQHVMQQAEVQPEDVIAVSFSGQMHGLVCLDKRREVVRPAIIWADQRSVEQCEKIKRTLPSDILIHEVCNPVVTGFMLPSWLWLKQHERETVRKTRWLLLPKDYLRLCFTGELYSEPSDASGTLLFNVKQRTWSKEVMNRLDISPNLQPEIIDSAGTAGKLLPHIASVLGLMPGIPVICGASDQSCQAVAQGAVLQGDVTCTIGTGGQVLAVCQQPIYDASLRVHLFCHAVPATWHLEAATLSAGLSLKWLRETMCPEDTYADMADLAASISPGSEGLIFRPYLLGERTPLMDPDARASFTGLSLRHSKAHLIRAVMEGVVFSLRQGYETLERLGVETDQITLSGGGTRHALWQQLVSDIFNKRIRGSDNPEASARGAAILAAAGSGVYGSVIEASNRLADVEGRIVLPNPKYVQLYDRIFGSYCDLMTK